MRAMAVKLALATLVVLLGLSLLVELGARASLTGPVSGESGEPRDADGVWSELRPDSELDIGPSQVPLTGRGPPHLYTPVRLVRQYFYQQQQQPSSAPSSSSAQAAADGEARLGAKRAMAVSAEDRDHGSLGEPVALDIWRRLANSHRRVPLARPVLGPLGSVPSVGTEYHDLNDMLEASLLKSLAARANSPKFREKRRRCAMDPNLGVKNPSFCDAAAYFGTADYNTRDVWDSMGRRR